MSKRAADTQITQDSLEKDEEPEDAGRFERASQEELENRVFKKARRTRPADSADRTKAGQGLFSGIRLTGLQSQQQQNGLPQSSQATSEDGSSTSSCSTAGGRITNLATDKPTFLSQLCNLNTSVYDWIGKHVKENPYVDLTPIFRDYEKHLRELDGKFSNSPQDRDEGREEFAVGALETQREARNEEEGVEESAKAAECGENSLKGQAAGKEEEEALLSVRAKLFFKRSSDSEFCELGLGQLRVLPGGEDHVRVVMRNDTSLAKVLLNVRVSGALPVSCRKNNVLLVSPPNPPLEKAKGEEDNGSAPVTYLIRVKTAAMATELLQSLQCSDR